MNKWFSRSSPPMYFGATTVFIWFTSFATMSAGRPELYSPLALIIVIPSLCLGFRSPLAGAFIGPIIFSVWCFPLLGGQRKVPLKSKILALIILGLSVLLFVKGWHYGVMYQGIFHTAVMCSYNVVFSVALFILERRNHAKPTFKTNMIFHALLFTWLTWAAFPWLGELL
jgi:lysylphosphatidylglycerol synthetase-like protein (DUF2156 family)